MANDGKCSEWRAVHYDQASGPATLSVTGKCAFEDSGYSVELKPHVPQGTNPKIYMMDKIVHKPNVVSHHPTTVNVRYSENTNTLYNEVHILPDDLVRVDIVYEGTVVSDELPSGAVTFISAAGTRIRVRIMRQTLELKRLPAKLADIRINDFIGVAARKEADGTLTAVSINIFPPEVHKPPYDGDGFPEGQFPTQNGDIMTNGYVTNVSDVVGGTVSLAFKEGAATITVPPGTEIHRLESVPLGSLREGMRATVRGSVKADGSVEASAVIVKGPMQ